MARKRKLEQHIRTMEGSIRTSMRIINDVNRGTYIKNKARKGLYYFNKQIELTKLKLK